MFNCIPVIIHEPRPLNHLLIHEQYERENFRKKIFILINIRVSV